MSVLSTALLNRFLLTIFSRAAASSTPSEKGRSVNDAAAAREGWHGREGVDSP
jgi:hypothetical protein